MRVLFVTPYVPSRIRVRPFQLIKALSAKHEISLVALLCDEYEQALVEDVARYCDSVDLVPLPKRQAYANCLRALPTRIPLRIAYYQSPVFSERVLTIIRERNIDVVHGELIKTVPTLRAALAHMHIPVIYDSVDCISSYLSQQWRSARNPLKKAFAYSEFLKMSRYEPLAVSSFDATVITSDYDRDYLTQLGVANERVSVVPNGVDLDYFTPPNSPRDSDSLVFCAKMDYYPNIQAMLRFCREVLPLVWQQRPRVHLTIVGNNPPQVIRDLSADARITVTGYVPDIRPYLGSASIALAPLLVAAGMQNKVLEALAMGTPVVASPGACRSLHVQHKTHLLIAEGVERFAEAILHILADFSFAADLSRAGRGYVEQHHNWDVSAALLNTIYQQAAAHTQRTAVPLNNG